MKLKPGKKLSKYLVEVYKAERWYTYCFAYRGVSIRVDHQAQGLWYVNCSNSSSPFVRSSRKETRKMIWELINFIDCCIYA